MLWVHGVGGPCCSMQFEVDELILFEFFSYLEIQHNSVRISWALFFERSFGEAYYRSDDVTFCILSFCFQQVVERKMKKMIKV